MYVLPIPPAARSDPNAAELVRVWAASDGQHVSIHSGAWEESDDWGVMLADLAHHVANMFEQRGIDRELTLSKIRETWNAEFDNPINDPTGSIHEFEHTDETDEDASSH